MKTTRLETIIDRWSRRPTTWLSLFLVLIAAAPQAAAQDTPRMGGVLKAAMIGEPPSLDLHATTAVITQQITWHVLETLYTYDKNFNPIPMLAEGHTVTDGGRRYTIALRKGVKFHTGKEMTFRRRGALPPALGQDVHARQAHLEGRGGG